MPLLDTIAITWFLAAWILQSWATEASWFAHHSLSRRMATARRRWMHNMGQREVRIVDTQIMNGLQSGTAFFATTSMLAIGGIFSAFNASEKVMAVLQNLPLVEPTPSWLWDVKLLGLMLLYAYAFFKFGWAYRLFNYTSILVGAVPANTEADTASFEAAVNRAAGMNIEAGLQFSRGQRAFFLAVGYLGWFINGWALMVTTTILLVILVHRQYFSSAHKIVAELDDLTH